MKDYFLKLFGYDHFTNEVMLEAVLKAGNPGKAVTLMAHVLAAQQVWLSRCREDITVPAVPLWPTDWTTEYQLSVNRQNHAAWLEFLSSREDAFWERTLTYQNSTGKVFTNVYTDVLGHLINHGTHHRAQVGQVLKKIGIADLPATDYIAYLRH